MITFVAEIEMCLNSRPLTPLTDDVDDLSVLTPNHLLTGYGMSAPPEPVRDEKEKLDQLSHWNLVRAMRNQFWVRWSKKYLYTLMQRTKWQQP